jgi:hypothetical protein
MRRKEGLSTTYYRKFVVALIFCYIITSISTAYAPQDQHEDVEAIDSPKFTSQYNDSGALNFSSDEDFQSWASLNSFEGDGSFNNPLYITGLNVTGLSEPSLKLSNITRTWFIFEDCIFQTHLWYAALDLRNVTKGFFTDCTVFGAVLLNGTAYSAIMHSFITDAVYVEDALDTIFADNWFDENANVYVLSIYITTTNVSFVENTFLGELYLFDCTNCNIVYNFFLNSVADDGFANTWDSNRYVDYDGFGPYNVPGSAESIDFNPYTFETDPPTGPPPTTTSIETTSPNPTPTVPSINAVDYVLFGIICFEIGIVIMIVTMKRRHTQ